MEGPKVYVCICARVAEREVRSAIHSGACTEEAVGDTCGAGTGCGTCLDRICELIDELGLKRRDTLAGLRR